MAENTIAREKHEEMAQKNLSRGLSNIAQEPLDLVNQRSRSNKYIAIGGGKWSPSEAALWEITLAISTIK